LALLELKNRGLDKNGKWVGLSKGKAELRKENVIR
jgi:hypothetical protein